MVAFSELDRNARSELHPDENVNRNVRSEQHLDENVAILGFGDSLEYISGFSFKIQDQIALMGKFTIQCIDCYF